MNTLIIPCAGKSSRFPGMPPKWLLKYPDGKLMVEKAVAGLPLHTFDRIIVTAVKEHLDQYDAAEKLDRIFSSLAGEKYEVCILDDFTSCQAETVYETIRKCGVVGRFAVKDSDNYIRMEMIENPDYVVGIDIQSFPKEIERLAAKSFLMVNSQGIITDIIEKKIVSQFISIGMYGFGDAALFCEAYKHIAETKGMANEIYLSHVISYLIGARKSIYTYVEASEYEDWGTRKDWYAVLNRKKTYFINAEDVLIGTSDGSSFEFISENLDAVRKLSEDGAQIVLLSSMNAEQSDRLSKKMIESGVPVHCCVPNCYTSHQVIIGCYSSEVPFPACESINISRGEMIGDKLLNER